MSTIHECAAPPSSDGGSIEMGTAVWHAMAEMPLLAAVQTSASGLSGEEAAMRLDRYGPNVLVADDRGELLRIMVRQIRDPLIYVLLGSTFLAMLTGKFVDGLVICGVVVLNAIIGFVQEYRASKAIKELSAMIPTEVAVLRDGEKRRVPAAELVPGDVVVLEPGDKVAADMRLLHIRNLRVEEAALTGESVPVEKTVGIVQDRAAVADRVNMVYSGTLVTQGTATAAVVATGMHTELGRISRMLEDASLLETPLTRQLAAVGKAIALSVVFVSLALFGIGMWRGFPVADTVLAAVALAVAAIPEGLPAIVTIALAIGVRRMARRGAVIRRLPAVETLGSTTVICSDKTGTLTRNEMTVQALWTQAGHYRLTGTGYEPVGELLGRQDDPLIGVPGDVAALLAAGALCNDASIAEVGGEWVVSGDPTEGALLVAEKKLRGEAEAPAVAHPRIDAIPFESERQFMATLNEDNDGGQAIYLKGAPEVVLAHCKATSDGDNLLADTVSAVVGDIASRGMRVLAFAVRRPADRLSDLGEGDVADGFTFLGLQGMIDPPRPSALKAISACRTAGIAVKMITGDHKETAVAIGREFGFVGPDDVALTGTELAGLSATELRAVAKSHAVFARVAPEHKLRLVEALQAEGHVVAMTGDGVNDAPALKQADIGVAMGITGTSVSKESADMVLTDDNFATIVAAVEEGRRVYDNLIKAFAFVLPTNLGLAFILMAAVAAFPIVGGEPLLPMAPVQILWINLVAAVALALPLGFEAMEPNVMGRPPRRPDAPVLGPFVLIRTAWVALLMAASAIGLFLWEFHASGGGIGGRGNAEAQTMAVTTVVMFQIFYLLGCRSLRGSVGEIGIWSNPWIYAGIGALLALQLGFTYLPFMNAVFGSVPIGLDAWARAAAVAFPIMPMIGIEKWWLRRRDRRHGPGA